MQRFGRSRWSPWRSLYAPTLGRGLVNYDDPWLVRDNWLTSHASWTSLHAICCDLVARRGSCSAPSTCRCATSRSCRLRDLGHVVWRVSPDEPGDLRRRAIVAWFVALCAFGFDRPLAGVAVLMWALHPSHAESVAWIAERKGVLAALFAGLAALGYARFRAGRARWLVVLAALARARGVEQGAVVFALASLAGLELALPAQRRRAMAAQRRRARRDRGAALAAFVPVLVVARALGVVDGATDAAPAPGPGHRARPPRLLHAAGSRRCATRRRIRSRPPGPRRSTSSLGAVTLLRRARRARCRAYARSSRGRGDLARRVHPAVAARPAGARCRARRSLSVRADRSGSRWSSRRSR